MRRLLPGAALALVLAGCPSARPPSDFNLILVTLDTTRADRIGAFGGDRVPTPTLDRLAREGTIARDATAQVPLTLPSHATLLTGRYPDAHGVRHNGIYRLRDEELTLAEHLRAAGFATAAFVGAYVLNRGFGTEQGFDTYDDIDVNRFAGGRDQVFEAQRTADEVNARVIAWLDAHAASGRFFAWVHYYDPHDPYDPPEKPGRTLAGTGYEREISYVDACLGDLVKHLGDRGLAGRTMLAVAGDHGESLGDHGEKTHGVLLYQGALRVPLVIRAPGLVPSGRAIEGPVELLDLAPTLLDYLGVAPLPRAEGKSLRARIDGRGGGDAPLARAETLMPRLEFGWSELRMIRDARFKYIDAPRPELYDLVEDPDERRNLAAAGDPRVEAWAERLAAWTASREPGPEARRTLDPDEEARLRSLGYLGGTSGIGRAEVGGLVDPKDGLQELRALDEARGALDGGDARTALAGSEAILRANPLNHQARTTAVLALIQLGDLARAEDEAQKALAATRDDTALLGKARGMLASVYRLRGKTREAEAEYRRLLAADAGNETASIDLARLLIDAGRLAEAARFVEDALRRSPRNGMAMAARFQLATAQGDEGGRLAAARALAGARTGDPPTLVAAAELLARAGDHAGAALCYETIVDQSPRPDPELLGKLGVSQLKAGALDPAAATFERFRAERPADPRPPYYLGVIAAERGDAASARAWYRRALALDPGYARAAAALRGLERPIP